MAKAARLPELQEAFQQHLAKTERQIELLDKVFELLGEKAKAKPCKGMAALIAEGQEVIPFGSGLIPAAAFR
jgi:Mn-containing catalase